MKKNILLLLSVMVLAQGLTSCSSDEMEAQSVISVTTYVPNEFDLWLEENFRNPYNIDFKYRYEEIESDLNYYTVPASYEESVKMAHLVKYLCVETYNEVAGIEFTRSQFPKMFFLIGEWEYRNNGSFILGTAEGGRKILLSGMTYLNPILAGLSGYNDFPFEFGTDIAENLNHYYIKTIHHEFTHILNQTKDYPTAFRQVTPSSYVSDSQFSAPYNTAYLKRGFISAYAQTNTTEDFAEMVSEYVTHSPEWWEDQMKAADTKWEDDPDQTQTGRVLIEQKLDITRDYMYSTWSIDLDELRECILRRQADIINGKIDLTDLTINGTK
ncbi:MAG: putative zinc-binding metallopeptidase [Prevotella sp.]|nr:putative zinc-binding metallopeptidase [Prevotella sp.]